MAKDSRGLISQIGTKRLVKMIMSLYDDDIKLGDFNYDCLDEIYHESTLLSELLFLEFKRLYDNDNLITMLDGEDYQLRGSLTGRIDYKRSFISGVIFDNKVFTYCDSFTLNNKLYRLIRDALYIANAYLINENDKDAIKIVFNQNKRYEKATGVCVYGDYSLIKSNLKNNIDLIDMFLSKRSFETHYRLLRLCRVIFQIVGYSDKKNGNSLPSLNNAIEFILQQFVVVEFRRFLRKYYKYLPFRFSLLDSDRTLYKDKGGKNRHYYQADGVLKLRSKNSKDIYESCILDVKTNLHFTEKSDRELLNYANNENLYKIVSYCFIFISNEAKSGKEVKPNGLLFHLVFDSDKFEDNFLSDEYDEYSGKSNIRYAVKNFKDDNVDMSDLFAKIIDTLYGTNITEVINNKNSTNYKVHFFNSNADGIFNKVTKELTVLSGSTLWDGSIINEDRVFKSCSGAGKFVYGRNSNGWEQWLLDDNRPISVLR